MKFQWRTIWLRLKAVARRKDLDRDLEDEVAFHLAMREQKNRAAGIAGDDARYSARRQFGNMTGAKEKSRDMWTFVSLETLWQDVRYGARMLRRSPGFSAIAVLTLAVGIGASTAVFSLVNAVLLRSLPYQNPQDLAFVWTPNSHFQLPAGAELGPMNGDFYDLQKQNHSFSEMALFTTAAFNLAGEGISVRAGGSRVTGQFFETLGVPPILGRVITPEDDQPGKEHVVVITDVMWQSQFGRDPAVLGKTLMLDAQPYAIVGVMPAAFAFPHPTDLPALDATTKATELWIPAALTPQEKADRDNGEGDCVVRLRPGVSLQQAQAEMSALMAQIDQLHVAEGRGWSARVKPFVPSVTQSARPGLLLLLGAVSLVLLIACSNVANLLMARGANRMQEMGVRAALGAQRLRLVRQLLTESLFLAGGGGALGIFVAYATIRVLVQLSPGNIPRLEETSLDGRVLLFCVGLSLLTGLLFGVFPALSMTRRNVGEVLKRAGSRGVKGSSSPFRSVLIAGEVALAVVLLTGSGLLMRSLVKLLSVDPGFRGNSVVTMNLALDARYNQPEKQIAFFRAWLDGIRELPGVQAAGAVTYLPLSNSESLSWLTIEGYPYTDKINFETRSVTPDYFAAMGIHLIEGRYFTNSDSLNHPLVAVVSQSFAKKYSRGQNVLRQRIHFITGAANPTWIAIVGVVADVHHRNLEETPGMQVYTPFWQASDSRASMVVRGGSNSAALITAIRGHVRTLDPLLAVADIRSMDDLVSDATAGRRFQTLLLSVFAGIALSLALIGLYAVLAYSVKQRTAEIGIRVALGASRRDVVRLIVGQSLRLTSIGVAFGLLAALAMARVLSELLFGVSPADPVTLVGTALSLGSVALLASYVPARRATRVSPIVALRYD